MKAKKLAAGGKITVRQRFLKVVHALFVAFMLLQLMPDRVAKPPQTLYVVVLVLIIEAGLLIFSALAKKRDSLNIIADIAAFIFTFLLLWSLFTAKLNVLKPLLFPPPGVVFKQMVEDAGQLSVHIRSSLGLIINGFALAAVTAIPLGLFLGYSARVGGAAAYISKFLGSIPPVVYIPYGIALLPAFRNVSVLVIFLASFWPILSATTSGVMYVERRIVDSARVLNVNGLVMLFRIILPAALPQVFIGCNQGLSVSFILLTSAEMIGARSGMGYYVKNYSDLGNYTRIIVGVFTIGIVISLVFFLFNKFQKFMLRWMK